MSFKIPILAEEECLAESEVRQIDKAMQMCVQAHSGGIHRDRMPAAMHSLRVAFHQKTPLRVIVGLLHDVIEDCGTKWEATIQKEFGSDVAYKVSLLTRRDGESYPDYIMRVCEDVDCMFVKMSDIEDNMHPLRSDEKARQKAVRYGRAHDAIMQRLIAHSKL